MVLSGFKLEERLRDKVSIVSQDSTGSSRYDHIKAFYILEGPYIDATRDEILNQYGSMNAYLRDELLE